MRSFLKPFVLMAVIIGLSAQSIYIIHSLAKIHLTSASDTPALILSTFTVKQFDSQGHLLRQLDSPKLTQYSDKTPTHTISPLITVIQKDSPWTITADEAFSYDNNNKILLQGHVVVKQQTQSKNNTPASVRTEQLWYYPKTQKAYTDKPVVLSQQGVVLKSRGMRVNLKNEKLELLHHARGRYEPNHA